MFCRNVYLPGFIGTVKLLQEDSNFFLIKSTMQEIKCTPNADEKTNSKEGCSWHRVKAEILSDLSKSQKKIFFEVKLQS